MIDYVDPVVEVVGVVRRLVLDQRIDRLREHCDIEVDSEDSEHLIITSIVLSVDLGCHGDHTVVDAEWILLLVEVDTRAVFTSDRS